MGSLSNREKGTIAALAECIIPEGGPIPYDFGNIDYLSFIKDMMTSVPQHIRWLIHFNLWVIEYFGWIYLKHPITFSKLTFHKREFILLSFRNSKRFFVRGIYVLTSALFLIPMYKNESVMNAIGYLGYQKDGNKIS